MADLLVVANLQKQFRVASGFGRAGKRYVKAVEDVSFAVQKGETYALVGESGSGKTTVGYLVQGIYRATGGEITFKGISISDWQRSKGREWSRQVQLVFQNPGSSLNPARTIRQSFAVLQKAQNIGHGRRERETQCVRALENVELSEKYLYSYPHSLSGGEKQRVAIALACLSAPGLIVLDEPTSALDVSVQGKIIWLLTNLQQDLGIAYLFITHDLSLVRNVAGRTSVMYLGRIVESAETGDLFQHPLHPYTQALLSSIPVISDAEKDLLPARVTPHGEIPSPTDIPSGCAFHPRCPSAMPVCGETLPQGIDLGSGHWVCCHLATASAEPASDGEGGNDGQKSDVDQPGRVERIQ